MRINDLVGLTARSTHHRSDLHPHMDLHEEALVIGYRDQDVKLELSFGDVVLIPCNELQYFMSGKWCAYED